MAFFSHGQHSHVSVKIPFGNIFNNSKFSKNVFFHNTLTVTEYELMWVLQHPCIFKMWVLAPTVFGKFFTFASIFIEMIRKMLQTRNCLAKSNFKHPHFEIPNRGLESIAMTATFYHFLL